jgi:hypothetical protein
MTKRYADQKTAIPLDSAATRGYIGLKLEFLANLVSFRFVK